MQLYPSRRQRGWRRDSPRWPRRPHRVEPGTADLYREFETYAMVGETSGLLKTLFDEYGEM